MIQCPEQQLSATFPPSPASARCARDFVRAGLHGAGIDQPALAEQLCLVASELVTNAVVHAGGEVEVRIAIDGRDIWLEVIDEAGSHPHRAPPSTTETGGRGLMLVDALTDAWGVAEVEGRRGKRVWVRLSRAGAD